MSNTIKHSLIIYHLHNELIKLPSKHFIINNNLIVITFDRCFSIKRSIAVFVCVGFFKFASPMPMGQSTTSQDLHPPVHHFYDNQLLIVNRKLVNHRLILILQYHDYCQLPNIFPLSFILIVKQKYYHILSGVFSFLDPIVHNVNDS